MQNPAGDSFTGTGATPTSIHSQSEMLRRTDSFLTYTLGETFHSLPSRLDKKFMTKQSTILALDS